MSTALRFTRAAFGAVQRASPRLAARWAERLFCSPPRRAISERMATWLGAGRRFVDLGGALLASGFRVVTFDAPGHGASSGRLSSGPEFARATLAVAAAVGPVSAVVGHSLGGFAAALAIERGLAARRAVFIAPSANANTYTAQFASLLGVQDPVMASMRQRLERRLDFEWRRLDIH